MKPIYKFFILATNIASKLYLINNLINMDDLIRANALLISEEEDLEEDVSGEEVFKDEEEDSDDMDMSSWEN